MTIGIIQLSEHSRKLLFKLVIIMSCIQLVLSLCEIIIGSYLFAPVANHFPTVGKEHTMLIGMYTLCFGITSFMISIINIKMADNCAAKPPMRNISNLHDFWIKLSIVSIVLNILYIFMLSEVFDNLVRLITDTFIHGIAYYLSDDCWKNTFDYFQSNLKCCGINKYTDWYEKPWISLSDLPQDSNIFSKYGRADGKVVLPIVPPSCCKPNIVNSKCVVDLSQLKEDHIVAASMKEIYTGGCIKLIEDIFSHVAILIAVLDSFITVLQFAIIFTGRYLYTSTRNSLLMGTPNDNAPGWLFGRADCGYIGGESIFLFDNGINQNIITPDKEYHRGIKRRSLNKKIGAIGKKLKLTPAAEKIISTTDSSDETLLKDKFKNKLVPLLKDKDNIKTEEEEELISVQENLEDGKREQIKDLQNKRSSKLILNK